MRDNKDRLEVLARDGDEGARVQLNRVLRRCGEIERRNVTIPARDQHNGHSRTTVTLDWVCPICGGPRGEPYPTTSYDGSRRLSVHGWKNRCGHIDAYSAVREEAHRQRPNS